MGEAVRADNGGDRVHRRRAPPQPPASARGGPREKAREERRGQEGGAKREARPAHRHSAVAAASWPGVGHDAFNSPFLPFVMAMTSVGQEGLYFHAYYYRVYHWNLPGNLVDLEQREVQVHRFKGHAVRLNLARRQGKAIQRRGCESVDP